MSDALAVAASGTSGDVPAAAMLVARFHEQYPGVEIDFRPRHLLRARPRARPGHTVELGVVGGLTVPPELDAEPITEDEVVLVGLLPSGARRCAALT